MARPPCPRGTVLAGSWESESERAEVVVTDFWAGGAHWPPVPCLGQKRGGNTVTGGDVPWGSGHGAQYAGLVTWKPTLETYVFMLTMSPQSI